MLIKYRYGECGNEIGMEGDAYPMCARCSNPMIEMKFSKKRRETHLKRKKKASKKQKVGKK